MNFNFCPPTNNKMELNAHIHIATVTKEMVGDAHSKLIDLLINGHDAILYK